MKRVWPIIRCGHGRSYHWNEELYGPGLVPTPCTVLQHEPFDTLEDKLSSLQTPCDGHLLGYMIDGHLLGYMIVATVCVCDGHLLGYMIV